MELKKYIENTSKLIIPSIDHLQLIEYKDKEKWNKFRKQAKTAARENQWQKSASFWVKAIEIDPRPAEAWYGLGLARKQLKLPYEEQLKRALLLDFHPGRPTPGLIQVVQEHKWPENVVLVPFSELFFTQSQILFHDSCHLTEEGNRIVAESFVQRLVAELGWGVSQLRKEQ